MLLRMQPISKPIESHSHFDKLSIIILLNSYCDAFRSPSFLSCFSNPCFDFNKIEMFMCRIKRKWRPNGDSPPRNEMADGTPGQITASFMHA